jgi:plasmid stabilization system protein ParE
LDGFEKTNRTNRMKFTIRFSQLASDDLTDILGWYQNQDASGLDKLFIKAMSTILKRLETNPELYPIVHKNVRQALLQKFPYKILYLIDGLNIEVFIVGVIHQKRKPNSWKKRI